MKSAGGGKSRAGEGAEVMMDRPGPRSGLRQNDADAMGLPLDVEITDTPDSVRIELDRRRRARCCSRRRAEALDALQHIVNTGVPPRAEGRPDASSSIASTIAKARTPS